jgi:hypothetical protein
LGKSSSLRSFSILGYKFIPQDLSFLEKIMFADFCDGLLGIRNELGEDFWFMLEYFLA